MKESPNLPKQTVKRIAHWATNTLFLGACIGILVWYYGIACDASELAQQVAVLQEKDDGLQRAQAETDAALAVIEALDTEDQRKIEVIQRVCNMTESIEQFPIQHSDHIVISERDESSEFTVLMYIPEGKHEFIFSVGMYTKDRLDKKTFDENQFSRALPLTPDSLCQFNFKASTENEKTLIQVSLNDAQGKILFEEEKEFNELRAGGGTGALSKKLIYYPGQFQPRVTSRPSIRFTRMLREHSLDMRNDEEEDRRRSLMFRFSLRSPDAPLFLYARDLHLMPKYSRNMKMRIEDMFRPDDGRGRYLLKQKFIEQFRAAPEFDF